MHKTCKAKQILLIIFLTFLESLKSENFISFGKKSIAESKVKLIGKRKLLSIFSQYQAEKAMGENNTIAVNFYTGFRYRVNRSRFPVALYRKVRIRS